MLDHALDHSAPAAREIASPARDRGADYAVKRVRVPWGEPPPAWHAPHHLDTLPVPPIPAGRSRVRFS